MRHSPFAGLLSGWRKLLILLCIAAMATFAVSYLRFVQSVHVTASGASQLVEKADGIVVLTGDANRISEGVKRLESKQARRMLISGVGQNTSRADLAGIAGKSVMSLDCCIDLDRQALDTKGNAYHAARWARLNGFEKLIIVTSDYHMPRSLLLMTEEMPNVKLIPVAVRSHVSASNSLVRRAFSTLVIREYLKFVAVALGVEPSAKVMVSALSESISL